MEEKKTEIFELPTSDYVVLSTSGNEISATFNLNNELFAKVLPEIAENYSYEDSFVVEIIKKDENQVELWFPVKKK